MGFILFYVLTTVAYTRLVVLLCDYIYVAVILDWLVGCAPVICQFLYSTGRTSTVRNSGKPLDFSQKEVVAAWLGGAVNQFLFFDGFPLLFGISPHLLGRTKFVLFLLLRVLKGK